MQWLGHKFPLYNLMYRYRIPAMPIGYKSTATYDYKLAYALGSTIIIVEAVLKELINDRAALLFLACRSIRNELLK